MDEPVVGTSLWKDAWRRLRRNRLAVLGMVVVGVVIVASLAGPPIIAAPPATPTTTSRPIRSC